MENTARLSIISQNFNGFKGSSMDTVAGYLKEYEADIIAGQELPANINEEKFMEYNGLSGLFDGTAEKGSVFFTGFYVNNKNYAGRLVLDKKISKIWDGVPKEYTKSLSFRDGFWCEKWIEFCGEKIRVINIHISPTYCFALRHSLLTYIAQIDNKYTIILGDFNAAKNEQTEESIPENDAFLREIEGENYCELISEDESKTGKGHYTRYSIKEGIKKGRKLDHIFVSKAFYEEFNYEIKYIDEVSNTHPDYESSEFAFTDHSGIKVSFWEK